MKIIVIGGGAAGFFSAISAAETYPTATVTILERGQNLLGKVRISGGGRCNVTHACFVPRDLVKHYPRGEKALMSPFTRFAAQDTIDWFEQRGVELKEEEDGRVFPISDNSETIVECLMRAATQAEVEILRGYRVEDIIVPEVVESNLLSNDTQTATDDSQQFSIITNQKVFKADKIIVATGSSTEIWKTLKNLGHTIVQPVPSLFTFNIKDSRIADLAGLSVLNATVHVQDTNLKAQGPLLITHWGLSGPSILKLSAWGARELFAKHYHFTIKINWTGHHTTDDIKNHLNAYKLEAPKKQITTPPSDFGDPPQSRLRLDGALAPYLLPTRLWQRFIETVQIPTDTRWADITKKHVQALAEQLTQGIFEVKGKSTFKEEFVTAGGVQLNEVNFKTFESKIVPNLYFAGEVLDIDAITGGFNFQAAWTGGWIVGKEIGVE